MCIDDAYKLHYTSLTVNDNCKIFWMKDQMKSTSFTSFCDSLGMSEFTKLLVLTLMY